MCGIFGIVSHNSSVPEGLLERGTQSLAHRGPDDSGTILIRDQQSEIGLGNRRLAILDLSPSGHQPMHDPETGNWIVYNGEIYNFKDLRTELERLGAVFVSLSDTEVLLKAYARWGADSVSKLRGMFAFALWDAKERRLFIARDPMGIKPLYYAQIGSYFVFASEVRSLLGTGLISRQLNPAGLINYLTFGSTYDPLTIIDGIRVLPAGHTLTWKSGSLRRTEYWDLVESESAPEEISAAELRSKLEEAVRLQLVSDVPVGVFLSGGIDSSALVSILARGGTTPSTFSVVFREADFSEAQHSRAIARKFATDHYEITVSQTDALNAIPDALRAMDLPTMDGINSFFVSRATREAGVKVALSGLGGDEVFAGYGTFRAVPRMERFASVWKHMPLGLRAPAASVFSGVSAKNDQNRKLAYLARSNGHLLHPYFLARMLFIPQQQHQLVHNLKPENYELADMAQKDRLQRSVGLDPINRVSYLESRCYMLNTLLRDSDFMSMSQGLEVRVPLIDHLLAKTVLRIPGKQKLNATPKKLLVESLDGSLPDEIIHRPKRGFTLPFEHWMRQELRAEIEPTLDASRISDGPLCGLLNGLQVQRVWKDFMNGVVSWSRPWSLYVLQRWCEMNL